MCEAFRDPAFASGPFGALYDLLAPSSIDVNTGERLVRIDQRHSEYFLFQTFWVLFKSLFTHDQPQELAALETQTIIDAWENLPAAVVGNERRKRPYLSGVLARNEVSRDYAYNRRLFKRRALGCYQFNSALSVRQHCNGEDVWTPIFEVLNYLSSPNLRHPYLAGTASGFPSNPISRKRGAGGLASDSGGKNAGREPNRCCTKLSINVSGFLNEGMRARTNLASSPIADSE